MVFQQKPSPSLKNNQLIDNLAPPDQKFLNNLISLTNKKVSRRQFAKAKYSDSSKQKLCSSNEFNAYDPKKDWVGC